MDTGAGSAARSGFYSRNLRALGHLLDERRIRLMSLTAVPDGFIVVGTARDTVRLSTAETVSFFVGYEELAMIEEKMRRGRHPASSSPSG